MDAVREKFGIQVNKGGQAAEGQQTAEGQAVEGQQDVKEEEDEDDKLLKQFDDGKSSGHIRLILHPTCTCYVTRFKITLLHFLKNTPI